MESYVELLNAVDQLLALVDGIKPIGGEYTAELRLRNRTPRQIPEEDEARLIARDYEVRRLANLGEFTRRHLPKPEFEEWEDERDCEGCYVSTGLFFNPWTERRVAEWRGRMMFFRSMVQELSGKPESNGINAQRYEFERAYPEFNHHKPDEVSNFLAAYNKQYPEDEQRGMKAFNNARQHCNPNAKQPPR